MRKFVKIISMILVMAFITMTFIACNDAIPGPQGEQGIAGVDGKDGENGKDGQNGKDGENGKSAYEIAVENGFSGTVDEWLYSLVGEQGEKGNMGSTGPKGEKGDDGIGIASVESEQIVEGGQTYLVIKVIYTDSNRAATVNKILISDPYIVVNDTASAQEALDNAKAGDIIKFEAGTYGTLYLRQSSISERVDISDWAGGADTERFRAFDDITILGGEGVIVEGIHIEAGHFPTGDHSNVDYMKTLSSYISIKNLTVKDIHFRPQENKTIFDLSGGHKEVDGLYLDGCTLEYPDVNGTANRFVYQGSQDVKEVKDRWSANEVIMTSGLIQNISITNCTVKDAHQVIELRNAKNITISGNTFENIRARDILLVMGDKGNKFSGKINITNNVSTNSGAYFVRMNGVNAAVVISGNTVNISEEFTEESIAKITKHDGSYIEFSDNTWNGLTDKQALEQNKIEK